MPKAVQKAKRYYRPLVFIILFAILIRVTYLLIYASMPDWLLLTVDNYYHVNWAEDIASGNIFGDTTYFRAPFYVYCLAFLFSIFGISLWAARLFGLLLGIASIYLTFQITSRLFSQRAAVIASLIQAVFPVVLYFESELLLDALFMFLVELSFYRFLVWNDYPRWHNSLLLGLSLGLTAITRPIILIFVLPLFTMAMLKNDQFLLKIKPLTVISMGLALLILPITLRNIVIGKEPVLIAAQAGINFYIGNNADSDGLSAIMPEPLGRNWQIRDITYLAEKETGRELKPGEVSAYWFQRGLADIKDRPLNSIKLFAKKLYFNFSNQEVSNNRNLPEFFGRHPLLELNPLSFGLIFSLAVFAIFTGWPAHFGVRTITILIAIYVLTVSVFFYSSRYRLPVLPFYIILAAVGIETLLLRIREAKRSLLLPLGTALVAALVSIVPLVSLPVRPSTQYWNLLAMNYYLRNDFIAALPLFRNAVKADSTSPNINLNMGACFLRLAEIDSALFYFEREKKFNAQRSSSYSNIASIYLLQNMPVKAFQEATRALELKPYHEMSHLIRLRAAAELKDDIGVDSLFNLTLGALAKSKYAIAAANFSGIVLSRRNAREPAKELLARAAQLKPPPIETNDDTFTADYSHVKQAWFSEKAMSHYQLGYIYGIEGDYYQSISESRAALALNPNLVQAYINLANGLNALSRFNQADSVLNIAKKRFPNDTLLP